MASTSALSRRAVDSMAASGAAGEAAAAAEFAEKKYVWLPDKTAGYLSAWVVREEDGGETSVCSLADGSIRNVPTFELSKMNPPKFEKAEDIADLTFLNEASVVHNLRQRYFSGLIYTYSGLFLVAVNPYHALPIYTDAIIQSYKGRRREENAPHVFALADVAMRNMLDARENQSLLVTGESGAGKTENTKKVIQYLAAIAADPSATGAGVVASPPNGAGAPGGILTRSHSSRHVLDQLRGLEAVGSKRLGLLERQILQANPILEAFGNAQTIRNNNSSRFGKFVRIEFTSLGAIAGANVDWYLLEKSRVTNRSDKERSFHVFYQLLRSGDDALRKKLLLSDKPEHYGYLKSSRQHVEGIDDTSEWQVLLEALAMVGFTPEEQGNLFRVIAAILHVGNIELADDRSEQARITNSPQVEKVCHLLGLPEQELTKALLRPRIKAGREWVAQARTKKQVTDEMAALCKTLYEKMFATIVDRINQALDRPTSKSTFIGVLDIAGFEIFEINSFEQLLINFTNEKLQQFFNHHMFVLEQEEYAREDIEWDFVNFGLDLQPTIDLIESTSPIGILSCLDEECIMPKASDLTFTEKLNRLWSTNKDGTPRDTAGLALATERGVAHGSTKYAPARFAQGFTVKHYAGDVEYRTDGWLDRNKDPLNDNLTRVMSESTDRFVASLFAEFAVDDEAVAAAALAASQPGAVPTGPKRRVRRGAFRTVAQRHKEQLTSLMTQLGSTQPHFVRCIVPNSEKRPGKMDVPIVLDQLRCNGVLEGIRIARLGYPNRLLFTEFRNRYEVLTPGIIPRGYMDGRKACQRMVEALELDRAAFKVGLTKIFFKAGVLAEMEERRDSHLFDIFSRFQGACRMFTARRQMKKILNRAAAVRTIQRNARLYVQLREWPWWQLYTKVRPLLTGTRHEEELKRKATELALITERAERDQREREALEALKFSLEAEKKRVEDALEAERSLLADKDQLLARSKERESQLEEDLAAMQVDVDQLDSQLERALVAQRTSETSRAELKTAFDAAAEHLLRLEQEQKAWQQREAGLVADLEQRSSELVTLGNQRSSHAAERAELDRKLAEKEQDVQRAEQRMAAAVAELEAKLASESRARETERLKATKLEESSRQSSHQLAELARSSADFEAQLQKREAEKSELSSQIAAITRERDSLARQISELQVRVETLTQDVKSAQGETRRAQDSSAQLQRELDETRSLMDAKTSEDSKQKELQRLKEQELQGLRSDIAALQKQKAEQEHSTAERVTSLRAEVDAARREHAELTRSHQDLTSSSSATDRQLAEATAAVAAAEQAKRAAQDQLDDVRTRAHTAEQGLQEARSAHEASERQLAASATKQRDFEDAILALERGQGAWKAKADQAALELSAESKRRELLESGARQHERNLTTLQQQHTMKDAELARLREVLAATQAELKTAQSMTNKTIVEHVHVLEEAKKYTDRQLADAQSKLQELAHYTKTLEKSKARLISDNEDLTREVSRLSQADRTVLKNVASSSAANSSAGTGSESRAVRTLENKLAEANRELQSARRDRDSAQSDARRKDLQHSEALSRSQQAYEKRIAELERTLNGSHNTFSNLSELVKAGSGDDRDLRKRLLEQLKAGNDQLEQDMSSALSRTRNGASAAHVVPPPLLGAASASPGVSNARAFYEYGNVAPSARNGTAPAALKRGSVDFAGASRANDEARRAQIAAEAQLADARQRLERETQARREDSTERARLEKSMQEMQINHASLSAAVAEARDSAVKAQKAHSAANLQLNDAERGMREQNEMLQQRDEHIAYLEQELQALETRLLSGDSRAESLLQASRERFKVELESVEAEVEAHRRSLQSVRDENLNLRLVHEELARTRAELAETQAAYESLCDEAGVDSDIIMSLQRAVSKYKQVADDHMSRWQAASRELETQTATLRRSNTVRAGSVPPVSPNRSAMPMAMHR